LAAPHFGGDLGALHGDLGEQRDRLTTVPGQSHAPLLDLGPGVLHRRHGDRSLTEDVVPQAHAAHQIVEAGGRQGDVEEPARRRFVHGDHTRGQVAVRDGELIAGDGQPALVVGDAPVDHGEALGRRVVASGHDRHLAVESGDLAAQPDSAGPGLRDRVRGAGGGGKGEGDGQDDEGRERDGSLRVSCVGHAVTS